MLNHWMRKVKARAGVDVDRLGFHAYKRAGIRTKEFRALPPKVQEQLTGTTHAMLRAVYDEGPFEELEGGDGDAAGRTSEGLNGALTPHVDTSEFRVAEAARR